MQLDFLLTSFIVVASPGTGALVTIAAGLSRGRQASLIAAFGCTLGIVPHMLAAITGLAALLHTSAVAFQAIKYLGVAYLAWMAWQTLQAQGALRVEPDAAPRSAGEVIWSAILVNLLNPKLSLFFFAFLPQFVDASADGATQRMFGLSLVFMAMTFAVFALYGMFAAAMRNHVLSRPAVLTWMRRCFAAAFLGLGAKLALAQR